MMNKNWFKDNNWFNDGNSGDGGSEQRVRKPNFHFKLGRPLWILLIIAIAAVIILPAFSDFYTELLWFRSQDISSVFWTRLIPQGILFLAAAAIAFFAYWFNFRKAVKNVQPMLNQEVQKFLGPRFAGIIITVVAIIFAIFNGLAVKGDWPMVLRFLNASPFGHVDPIFGNDVGFYVFSLPFIAFLQSWLIGILSMCFIGSAAIYLAALMPTIQQEGRITVPKFTQVHLTIIGFFIVLVWGVGYWIERFYLLYSDRGVAFGASYTDIHADLLALNVMAAITFIVAILLIVSIFKKKTWKFSAGLVGILIATSIILRGFYPGIVQKYVVEPNEYQKEKEYIEYNIQATRDAYDISGIKNVSMSPKDGVTIPDLNKNFETLQNIRLWDYRPLLRTFKQLQEIRSYYDFYDVDIDRYTIDGDYRQVILSGRELKLSELQNPTWVNTRLEFTHGYGLVMSPVNEIGPSGLPMLWVRDIPPEVEVPIEINRPEIYYGEQPNEYVFVNTTVEEFDYPMGTANARTTYEGTGGVSIGSFWRRLLYTLSMGDTKILFTNVFTDESKILLNRNVQQRLHKAAPFLLFDSDPYLTVIDGRFLWVQDAYTVTDRYPYSEPTRISGAGEYQKINYIRNSVKATVDAYDGTMHFYVMNEGDPIIKTWAAIFPDLFTSGEEMSQSLREHIRYPKSLFDIQAQIYRTYHMQNANTFYNKEDLWETMNTLDSKNTLSAYYVIMRLAEEEKAEFMLISPYMPVDRDNMIAWMAGRSDGENYGELLVYTFPKQKLVYGPSQIEALTDQTPEISAQLSLWSQRGSDVIRGHLLVIPVENALLYVQPLYLRAATSDLPELKRVIVSTGGRVVWGETLQIAMKNLLGESISGLKTEMDEQIPEEDQVTGTEQIFTGEESLSKLIEKAQQHWDNAQEALGNADWQGYGEEMQRLEETLRKLMQNAPSMPGQENNAPSLPLKNNEGLDNTELPTSQTELAD
jgi:hypothetical protein